MLRLVRKKSSESVEEAEKQMNNIEGEISLEFEDVKIP